MKRTEPLDAAELKHYAEQGFLAPVPVLTSPEATELRQAVDDHLDGRMRSERYELTDPIHVRAVTDSHGRVVYEYVDEVDAEPHTFPFLFNLWKCDERFARVANDPVIAGMARQLLGCEDVLLMEDNVVVKAPRSKFLPWHQDISYWPLETPTVVTVWIALDSVGAKNGAMQVVPGSHTTPEHLPVAFGDKSSFMREARPDIPELTQDPAAAGNTIVTYDMRSGECGFHHPLLWHASTPNTTPARRCALVLRYVACGTVWLGAARMPYDDIGCEIGGRLSSDHFRLVPTAF